MKKSIFTRRDALRFGAKATTGAALGAAFVSSPIIAGFKPGPAREFNVLKYGAVGDGQALDTAAIQRAIDEAAAAGGGARVIIPGGHRFQIGTLVLKSAIEFHMADDAELIISVNKDHYTGAGVITAQNAQGLKITGTGSLNGRSLEFMTRYDKAGEWWIFQPFRPKMFVLTGCKDLECRDFTFRDAPEWGLHMIGCENVLVDRIKIRNRLDVPNCDGIDPDHCRNVEIRNCDIVCGDDAIVIKTTRQKTDFGPSANIVVRDCVLETQDSGVKIGTETTSDIHNILFERCRIKSSCRGLTIQLRDEGDVYDIEFRDIQFVSKYHSDPWWGRGEAISFTAIPRTSETKLGGIRNVRVRNVTGRAENSVRVNGTPENRIHDVTMENVSFTLDRWTSYKGGLFDNRPTKVYPDIEPHNNPGFYIRYADNVTLKNCSAGWGKNLPDYFSHALEAEHVTGLKLKRFTGKAAHPDRDKAIVIK